VALFTEEEIKKYAFEAVIEDGKRCFARGKVLSLSIVGDGIIATVKDESVCRVVINREKEGLKFSCTCRFSYGGACGHVVAAMLAANDKQAIQMGLDFEAPASEDYSDDSEMAHTTKPAQISNTVIVDLQSVKPVGRLYLFESDSMLLVELRFAYHNGMVEFNRLDTTQQRLVVSSDGTVYRVSRSKARETSLTSILANFELMQYQTGIYTPCCDPRIWTLHELPRLAREGFEIYGQEKLTITNARKSVPKLTVSVHSQQGVFDCLVSLTVDGIPATLASLIMAVRQKSRFVLLSDGTSGVIPEEWLDKFSSLFSVLDIDTSQKSLKIKSSHLSLVSLLFEMADERIADSEFESKRHELQNFSGVEKKAPPPDFKASMRPYQLAGYEWFYFLKKYHFGGCLADDMGLGKTVQTLALLLNEKHLGEGQPSLVIVPTTLLFNWQREAQRFAPSLGIVLFHGASRGRYRDLICMSDVVLTSYGTVLRDIEFLQGIDFHYVILDEAQTIKNPASQIRNAIDQLRCRYRLALSGTPVENNLTELWSLFSFINPGMLGSYSNFTRNFIRPIEKELNENAVGVLRKMIFPFILRRTKQQVAKDLPPKNEIILYAEMLPQQKTLYEITKETYRGKIKQSMDSQGVERCRFQILEGLLRLRQICCHPRLFDSGFSGDSGKFQLVQQSIQEVVTEGHRVLVFSQFVKALELLRQRIWESGISSEILTGATRDRQAVVDRFQKKGGAQVFLISLKAGGTGLNLTSADYVMHIDPWWNPSAENQASDRAYRIGQTKTVFIYKVITRDSIEEHILQLQQHKKNLMQSVITEEGSFFKNLSREDVLSLFG
jgi:non-specific serine/threonine protein kinase